MTIPTIRIKRSATDKSLFTAVITAEMAFLGTSKEEAFLELAKAMKQLLDDTYNQQVLDSTVQPSDPSI